MKKLGKSLLQYSGDFVTLDVETTGLNPDKDNIIEIGALKYVNWRPVSKFQTLVRPPKQADGKYVSRYIASFTHITDKMLENEPSIEQVIPIFDKFLGDSLIVGYNVRFDINFLYNAFNKVLHKKLDNDYVDVLRIARRELRELEHHRLSDVVEYFGLTNIQAHRAFYDCKVTGECYIRFRDIWSNRCVDNSSNT